MGTLLQFATHDELCLKIETMLQLGCHSMLQSWLLKGIAFLQPLDMDRLLSPIPPWIFASTRQDQDRGMFASRSQTLAGRITQLINGFSGSNYGFI